jgi:thiol-disulfide isomerase/thioredoxin
MRKPILPLLMALALAACGAEQREPPDSLVTDAGEEEPAVPDGGYQDPGIPQPDPSIVYPAAPYGTNLGDAVADMRLYGYADPLDTSSVWRPIALSDFYDPNQNRGPNGTPLKLLWVNVSALWCTFCQAEAPVMRADCDKYKDKGLVCYTSIFEDGNRQPATRETVDWWARTYLVRHPITLDRSFRWSAYFSASTSPFNMLVDLQSMRILAIIEGFDKESIEGNLACILDNDCG